MLFSNRKKYVDDLIERTTYLFKTKIHFSGYIALGVLALLGLILCLLYCFYFVFAVGTLFLLAPSNFSVLLSAAFNSSFKAAGSSVRLGSNYLDVLLSNAGMAYILLSIAFLLF